MNRGYLISFEGPEGGGKSTQVQRLAERLRKRGVNVLALREPGGTWLGETVRNILAKPDGEDIMRAETETLLFCASRAQLCRSVIVPALKRGDWVVCDRFTDSTLAYQGYGRGINLDFLKKLNEFATGGLKPDMTLLLDLPVEVGMRRVATRSSGARDRIESEPLEFHERLRNGFLELADSESQRFVRIDATRNENEVADNVWETVSTMLAADVTGDW